VAVLVAMLALPIYLLSVGPVYWLYCKDYVSLEVYSTYGHLAFLLLEGKSLYVEYLAWWAPFTDGPMSTPYEELSGLTP